MKNKYLREQIIENIKYFERQLETKNVLEYVSVLCESTIDNDFKKPKEYIEQNIQTPEQAMQFFNDNNAKLDDCKNSAAKKIWNNAKNIVKHGISAITKNWKFIICAILIACAWIYVKMHGGLIASFATLALKLLKWIYSGYSKTPAYIMHQADANGGLNSYFDPGGWY